MTERSRNIAVGLTVMFALCLLGGMIVLFAGMPELLKRGQRIKVQFAETYDANKGDSVRLSGMRIGSIGDIEFTGGDSRRGVTFTLIINRGIRVPADVNAYVHSRGFVGSGYVELRPGGPKRTHPDTGDELDFLLTDRVMTIQGSTYPPGAGLVPREVTEAMSDLRKGFKEMGELASTLNLLLKPMAETPEAGKRIGEFFDALGQLSTTLSAINEIVADDANKANLKTALAGFSQAATNASKAMASLEAFARQADGTAKEVTLSVKKAGDNFDRVSVQMLDVAENLSALSASLNRTATQAETGKGTLSKMLNDPTLYNNLAESAKRLHGLMIELELLSKKWREEGVKIKLK